MRPIDADALINDIKSEAEKAFNEGDNVGSFWLGYIAGLVSIQPTVQTKNEWIPCSERLPRQGQEVLCQCRGNMIMVLKLDDEDAWSQNEDYWYMSSFVIAWMPLPKSYMRGE